MVVVGLIITALGMQEIQKAIVSKQWPSVQGTIITSKVTPMNSGQSGYSYKPDITYKFKINETEIDGNKLRFGEKSYPKSGTAQGIVKKFQPGEEYPVYYDPKDPSNAILQPGIHGSAWLIPGIGVAFILVSVFFVIIGIFMDPAKAERIERQNRQNTKT